MFKPRLISIAVSVLVVAIAFAAAFALPKNHEAFNNSKTETTAVSNVKQQEYMIKEYDGKVGVFSGSSTPDQVLDVYVETLPKEDQAKLKAGIKVKTHEELLELIEGYSN